MTSWTRAIRGAAALRARRARVTARAIARGGWARREAVPTDRDEVPILMVGCHRSGTSLMRRVVNSHPRIACPAETLFMEYLAAAVDAPDIEEGLGAIGISPEDLARQLRPLIDEHMRRYARARGKRRWADKSPALVHQLNGIDRIFEGQAQFVGIIRDGMDVAWSLGRCDPPWWQLKHHLELHEDPFVAAAAYWQELTGKLLDFAEAHPERVHLVRYEDLIASPEPTLRALFRFLGEPWDPCVLDFNGQLHDGGLEDHLVSTTTRFEDRTGKHRRLPMAVQARMWQTLRQGMIRAGYGERTYR